MEKCSIEPAQGTQARLWPVGKRSKARFLAPAYHQRLTLRAKRGGNAVDQPFALPQRVRLVAAEALRSEEHTSELQSLMRISYAVFCLKKKNIHTHITEEK